MTDMKTDLMHKKKHCEIWRFNSHIEAYSRKQVSPDLGSDLVQVLDQNMMFYVRFIYIYYNNFCDLSKSLNTLYVWVM